MNRDDLKVGDRYDYRDVGMTEPVRVVVERIEGDEVFTQLERERAGRRWPIDMFVENATVVVRLNPRLGE